jgi:hypothetical protein
MNRSDVYCYTLVFRLFNFFRLLSSTDTLTKQRTPSSETPSTGMVCSRHNRNTGRPNYEYIAIFDHLVPSTVCY